MTGSSHQCQALIVSCIDFRFQRTIRTWLEKNNLLGRADILTIPGGVKNLKFLLSALKISTSLHQIQEVILINHQNCGAYGEKVGKDKEKELNIHKRDLEKAEKKIKEKYPKLKIKKYFLNLEFKFILL